MTHNNQIFSMAEVLRDMYIINYAEAKKTYEDTINEIEKNYIPGSAKYVEEMQKDCNVFEEYSGTFFYCLNVSFRQK